MLDGHGAEIALSLNRDKVAPLGFNIDLVSISEHYLQLERLAFFVRAEIDTGDRLERHLTVKSLLSVKKHGIRTMPVDETRKVRRIEGDFHSVIEADNDGLRSLL